MFEKFIEKLKSGKFITLETTPPASATFDEVLARLDKSGAFKKIDGFSTTDSPLAKLKYNSILAAIKLQQKFNKPVLATMTMRDRNRIALQSDILGANDFDIRTFLALTGDPATISDQPNTKGVFAGNSLMLLDIIKCFNAGINYAGRDFKIKPKKIYPFAVANAHAKNPKTLINKMRKKIDHGSVGVITQPIFDIDNGKNLLNLFEQSKSGFDDEKKESQLILGVFPITKLKTAQFLSAHVPGIYVPKEIVDRLYNASKISEEEEYKVGMEISKNLFKEVLKIHPKMHIMTANKFDVANELLS